METVLTLCHGVVSRYHGVTCWLKLLVSPAVVHTGVGDQYVHWSGFNVDNLMLFSAAVAAHKSCSPALCQSHFLGSGEGEPALGCQVGGASGVLTEALHVAPHCLLWLLKLLPPS